MVYQELDLGIQDNIIRSGYHQREHTKRWERSSNLSSLFYVWYSLGILHITALPQFIKEDGDGELGL